MSSECKQNYSSSNESKDDSISTNNGVLDDVKSVCSASNESNDTSLSKDQSMEEIPGTSSAINPAFSLKDEEEHESETTEAPVLNLEEDDGAMDVTEPSPPPAAAANTPHRRVMLPRVNTANIVAVSDDPDTFVNEGTNSRGGSDLMQRDTDGFFSSLTQPPSALVRTTFPANTSFKSGTAAKLSGIQIVCGILELVCGFGISQGVDGNYLPFYLRSAMPIWTGAIYLMTAITGSIAVNSKRHLAIIVFLVFSLISLALSIALSALISPDVTGYQTESCDKAGDGTTVATETELLQCNEARLVTVLAAISLAFGLIDAVTSFVSCVLCGHALFRCCSKPDVNVLQEAPVFFRTGERGEVEANIITGEHRPPVIVPLPHYEDVVENTTVPPVSNLSDDTLNPLDVGALPPRTPPPAYHRTNILETSDSSSDGD